jgi:DNA mismatch repair protein MutL
MPSGIISLLPDHVANQIAAGEVVQRPASVVKELLENAIDAGATKIVLTVKDAGKTLITITDNGNGMNAFDARMCFERHATSKISSADDLFRLTTKGFRGEALASIAAVAQVELRTMQEGDTVAQRIVIEGGKFIEQEECQSPKGTFISVKNLFFNIPARRNFLKNDQVEQKHIIDEIERVALPHTGIHFIFHSNGNEVLNLPPGNLMQRIKSLLGGYIQKELVPVSEETPYVSISGYVALPEHAVRSKKEQFIFINDRYIRNAFLSHAIYEAYRDLISHQSHPRYFIFLKMNPADIDINIHPTKTEVKFTDDKTVYMLLSSAVKRALGKANAAPSLDFDTEMSFSPPPPGTTPVAPRISYNANYDPFKNPGGTTIVEKANRQHWETLYAGFSGSNPAPEERQQTEPELKGEMHFEPVQLNNKYIVTVYQNNVLIVDQQRAHERVIYERYMGSSEARKFSTQQLLFPEQLELSANDFVLIKDLFPEFRTLGFDVEIFGKNSIVVNGIPADLQDLNIAHTIEGILETYRLNIIDAKVGRHDNLCRSIARNTCIRSGKALTAEEMKQLLASLLACENPLYTAAGKTVMMNVDYAEIEKFFRK